LGVPSDWIVKQEKFGQGIRFMDPKNLANSHIRVSPGINGADHAASRIPNVKYYKNGAPIDANGNPIVAKSGLNQNKSAEVHIPYDKFKFH
jgi:hypothetical protein